MTGHEEVLDALRDLRPAQLAALAQGPVDEPGCRVCEVLTLDGLHPVSEAAEVLVNWHRPEFEEKLLACAGMLGTEGKPTAAEVERIQQALIASEGSDLRMGIDTLADQLGFIRCLFIYQAAAASALRKQGAEEAEREIVLERDRREDAVERAEKAEAERDQALAKGAEERDRWATLAGIGFDIARAAQKLLESVQPDDGAGDPATVSREAITGLQAALRRAEPEEGTPLDAARRQGAEEERERLWEALPKALRDAMKQSEWAVEENGAVHCNDLDSRDVASALLAALDTPDPSEPREEK